MFDIFGFEIVGEVVVVGCDVMWFVVGDCVCVLIFGGGYVEYVVVNESNMFVIFDGFGMVEVVVLLEIFMMVWFNLF